MSKKEGKQSFNQARAFLQKAYKEEAFEDTANLNFMSTGSIALDWVLGRGLAVGKIYEFFGNEGSGKTTAALTAAAEAQRQGRAVMYVDFEHVLDTDYARDMIGVSMDPNKWLVVQPMTAEAGFDMMLDTIAKFDIGLAIIDSVAAMVPKEEVEGEVSKITVGLQARVMGKGLRKLTHAAHINSTTVIFINQVRDKIGGLSWDTVTTPGGKALKFFASGRIQMSKFKTLDDGIRVKVQMKKSKVISSQKRKSFFDIRSGIGIDKAGEVLDLGVEYNIIKQPTTQSHKFPRVNGVVKGGAKAARLMLRKPKNDWYVQKLRDAIFDAMLMQECEKMEQMPSIDDDDPSLVIDVGDADMSLDLSDLPEMDVSMPGKKPKIVEDDTEVDTDTISDEEAA